MRLAVASLIISFIISGRSYSQVTYNESIVIVRNIDSSFRTVSDHGLNFRINTGPSMKKKVWRATKMVIGIGIGTMGILTVMPTSLTKWERDYIKDGLKSYKRAFTTSPKWDKDPWWCNYILHPWGGSVYYNGLRTQGATQMQSLIFSIAGSTAFEYVIEAIAERPSFQDLIVTPGVGYLWGETAHRLTLKMRNKGFNFLERTFVLFFNPAYVLFHGFKVKQQLVMN